VGPFTARPDDDAVGKQKDEDGTLAVLGFGDSTSVAVSRACRTPPTPRAECLAGVGLGVDDVVPEFGDGVGGSNKVPRLCSSGSGLLRTLGLI